MSVFHIMMQGSYERMLELTEKQKKLTSDLLLADKEVKRIKKELSEVSTEIESTLENLKNAKELIGKK
jgi:hypothetical protein